MASSLLTLWMCLCGIGHIIPVISVGTIEPLKYWVRDPSFEISRRSYKESEKHFPLSKIRSQTSFVVSANNITKLNQIAETKSITPTRKVYHFTNPGNDSFLKKPEKSKKGSLRMGPEEGDMWPRVQKSFKTRYLLRSTRMMTTDNVPFAEAKKPPHEEDPDSKKFLRPYTLKHELERFTDEFAEANVTLEVLSRTIEYNDIILLKATEKKSDADRHFRADENKYEDEVPEKKIVFIVHGLAVMGIHNIPCLVKVCRLRQLMSYYFEHLDKFDIFLIPVANPDGYGMLLSSSTDIQAPGEQKFSNTFYTNKNNSPQSVCNGVALDRNFEVSWNDSGAAHSCSPQYPGPKPFSEPETRAIRDVLNHYGHKIIAYIHVHAGTYDKSSKKGDAVLYPKGYTDVQSDDDKYIDLKADIEEMMKNASFKVLSVTVDTLHSWYGRVSGTSVDYASTIYGIPYSLEFVMQPYDAFLRFSERYKYPKDELSQAALEHVWKRVIDVTFNTIYRNMKNNDL